MRNLSANDKAFAILRLISVIGGMIWVFLHPIYSANEILYYTFITFSIYSLGLFALINKKPNRAANYYRSFLLLDFVFILVLINYTGGLNSKFYYAFYILASLHTFYFGTNTGLTIASLGSIGYLALGYRQYNHVYFGDIALEMSFLFMVIISIGYLNKQLQASNKRLEKSLIKTTQLYRISQCLASTLELEGVLQLILEISVEITEANKGSIMLLSNDKKSISKAVNLGNGIDGLQLKNDFLINKAISQKIAFTFPEFNHQKYYNHPQMAVPIIIQGEVIGIICLQGKKSGSIYSSDELDLINALASNAALAIENAKLFNETKEQALEKAILYEEMKEMYFNIIQGFVAAIEAKDAYTKGHSEQVTIYSKAIAESLGLSQKEVDTIANAALLHDIGKIGIDEKILHKPGGLNLTEFDHIKHHPTIGAQILSKVKSLEAVIPIIYHHHERYDGQGYIEGLKEKEVPLGSRIIAVADAYEAMTSNRPYRRTLSQDEAIMELRRCAGSQFDPDIVEIFVSILKQKMHIIQEVI